jgi:hydroxycarboxylate dehydrogenase B
VRARFRANQQATIADQTESLALVDGHRGYGQVIGEQAVRIGIDKASRCGIAMIGLRDVGHVGRVGDWAEMAADAGQVSLHSVGTTGIGALMVPFGGTDRRLSLCVVAAGIPRRERPPVIYDIATFGSAPAALAATRRPARQPVARLRTA